jgi:hypothetical protein
MKKTVKKLTLNRETVRRLEGLKSGDAGGGALNSTACSLNLRCGGGPPGDSGVCPNPTVGVCSNVCETGGACTVTCQGQATCF